MGDPLSVAASVAGLISIGLQSTEYLYKFYAAYRDRDDDLAKTAGHLDGLLGIIRIVHDVVNTRRWRDDERSVLQSLETCILKCEDVVNEFKDEIQKLQKVSTHNLSQRITVAGRRTAYPFRRSTLEKLGEDTRDFHDNLTQALEVLQLKEHQNTQQDVEVLRDMMRYAQARDLARDVRDWLRAPDATIDYNAASAKRHASTGKWFTHGQAFNTWLQQDNSFLWLYGFAGCGKTVLCSTTMQHVFRQRQSWTDSAVAFFFFTFNDQSKQDASALLRTLLAQLSGQVLGINTELARLKEANNGGTPPVRTLLEYLKQTVTRSRHTYILLDALDECPEGKGLRDDVLDTIETMRSWSLPGFHLLVTSRDAMDIRDALKPQMQEAVALRNDDVQDDIRQYVSDIVEHDPRLRRWQEDRQTIKDYLTEHANGVFRWVNCQLEPLRRCPLSKFDLEQCLKRLPSTLDATYERMLSTIDVYSRERARRILVLLCLAARELSVEELIEAIAVDVGEQERYDVNRKLSGHDDLLRICPGLIDIVRGQITNVHAQFNGSDKFQEVSKLSSLDDSEGSSQTLTEIVRIAHFSVQEYLLSDRIRDGAAASFAISESADHAQISKTCLIYLCQENFLNQTLSPHLIQQYALAEFAAQYWHHHSLRGGEKALEEVQTWSLALCRTEHSLARWIRLHNPDGWYDTGRIYYDSENICIAPALYYLALLGQHNPIESLLIAGADVDARGGHFGTALQAASLRGHERVVQVLLHAGADVNAQGGYLGAALQLTSAEGHERVVKILLDAGADVNAQGGRDNTALQAASYMGHERVVQVLLDAGADINLQRQDYRFAFMTRQYYGAALQAASAQGHERIVQVLLDAGADVNAQSAFSDTALRAAAGGGHEMVVQILLHARADVDVNADETYFDTALTAASFHGHERVVQILLNAGARSR